MIKFGNQVKNIHVQELIKNCPNICQIIISSDKINNESFEELSSLKSLKKLNLSSCESLEKIDLSGLDKLEELNLSQLFNKRDNGFKRFKSA